MTTPAIDLSVPGSPGRIMFTRAVADAMTTFKHDREQDLDDAAGVFYDTMGALLGRCDNYHHASYLFCSVLAAAWIQQILAGQHLTLTEWRRVREAQGLTLGVGAWRDGEQRNLEQVCPTCRHTGRFVTAVGNDDTAFADQILRNVIRDDLFGQFVAALLKAACDGHLCCHDQHEGTHP